MDRLTPQRRRSTRPLAAAVLVLLALAGPSRAGEPTAVPGATPGDATAVKAATLTGSEQTAEVVESRGSFISQGKTIAVERFTPRGPGRYPLILVLHGAGGTTLGGPGLRETARRLAARGYVAHVVHYFDLTGTRVADVATMRANFPRWLVVAADAITDGSSRPEVDPARVGLLGYSLGSYLSVSLSGFDPRVSAVVDYFGGLPGELRGTLPSLAPTLVLHGDADPVVPVTEAHALAALLRAKGVAYESRIYPGQAHGFTGPAADDAARRAFAFLETHCKAAAPAPPRPVAHRPPNPDDWRTVASGTD